MPKPFDSASKHLIESRPRDWLELAGFPLPASESDISIVDADLSSVMTLSADKLIRVDNPLGGLSAYLAHIEFQSSADAGLDARVHMYNAVARRRHCLPVWSAVFLLRPEAAHSNVKGRIADRLDTVASLDFTYHLIRVWELPTDAILHGGLAILPLAPITDVQEDGLPPIIAAVRKRLVAELPDQTGKEYLLAMRVLMGLKYQDQLTEALMQSIAEMTDSVEWQKIFRSGKAEGKVEAERQAVLTVGATRFGPPSPAMRKRIESISDHSQLSDLLVRVLTTANWEELLDNR